MKPKLVVWSTVLPVAWGLALTAAAAERTRRFELTMGEQRVLETPGLVKVVVPSATVADVRTISAGKVLLFSVAPGRTSFTAMFQGGRRETWEVTVRSGKAADFKVKCAELLGAPCTELQVVELGDKLVLRGAVRDLETYHKVRRIRKAFPEITVMVDVEPRIYDALVTAVNEELARAGINARISRVGSKLILDGAVADDIEKRRALAIVEGLYDATLGTD